MELTRYSELKSKGVVSLVKVGDAYAYSIKKFDVSTGELISPEIGAIDMDQLVRQKAELQKQITAIDAVIADLKALK